MRRCTALVLAAHGSCQDPLVNALARGQAERVRSLGLFDEVAVAFHHGDPAFGEALDRLEAREITVVPLLTSDGYYSRVVLPRELARNRRYAEVSCRIAEPVGTHPDVAPLVAKRIASAMQEWRLALKSTTVVLVGHGTRRHRGSRRATERLARILGRDHRLQVEAVFIDEEPGVEEALSLARHGSILVVPFLIAAGPHASRDIPRRLGLRVPEVAELPLSGTVEGRRIVCDASIGGDPGMLDIILKRAFGDREPARVAARPKRSPPETAPGWVHLVGAGPGDPELITVRGLKLLRQADVVVHDRLVAPELLQEAREGAEVVDAGKRRGSCAGAQEAIERLVVERARRGQTVVRLKGGDPFVFGRGWEELAACRKAGVPCQIVPGVSSAIAAPAAAGIPVTLRDVGRSVAVVTAHTREGSGLSPELCRSLAGIDTLVILMGHANLEEVLGGLIRADVAPDTPAACIEQGTTPAQRVVTGTVATLAAIAGRERLDAPVTTVVGEVVRCGSTPMEAWRAPDRRVPVATERGTGSR